MEDSKLNAIECLKTDLYVHINGRLNFSRKSATAANVHLTESPLDNWLKNNHITVGRLNYLRSLFVFFFFLRFLVFKFISQTQKTGTKTESCGNWLKLDLSE